MKLEHKYCDRIIIGNRELDLFGYPKYSPWRETSKEMRIWRIIGTESYFLDFGFKMISDDYFYKVIRQSDEPCFAAFHTQTYCFYDKYKFTVKSLIDNTFILFPEDEHTVRHLKYSNVNNGVIEIPYEVVMDKNPIIWEERQPVFDFKFSIDHIKMIVDNGFIV